MSLGENLVIVVAPGSFKGTMTSAVVANAMLEGVRCVFPSAEVQLIPLADGGEGTLDVFAQHLGGVYEKADVLDPLGKQTNARWLRVGKQAIIETCQAIGMSLLDPASRNPMIATSFGAGQLIKHALNGGAEEIYVGMGDSATMDLGIGMLSALGVRFYNSEGILLPPLVENMRLISKVEVEGLDSRIRNVRIVGLCDTVNPLCGENGHCRVYGEQKGLRPSDALHIEEAFQSFGGILESQFGVPVSSMPLTSASGGLAAALRAVLNAELVQTTSHLDALTHFKSIVAEGDIVLTGEGCFDKSSSCGKVPYEVAKSSKKLCFVIVGGYTMEGFCAGSAIDTVCFLSLPSQSLPGREFAPEIAVSRTTSAALRALSAGMQIPTRGVRTFERSNL